MAVSDKAQPEEPLPGIERRQRSDAARNRERLLQAAAACFRERGLEVGVGEIAERAGVGRATLFRNFPSKQDLIVAVFVDEMRAAIAETRRLLESPPGGGVLFPLLEDLVDRQQGARSLVEAVGEETFLTNPEVQACHAELLEVLDRILEHDRALGLIRQEVTASDVLMLTKGVCSVASSLESQGAAEPAAIERHLSFVRAAISTSGAECPLSGCSPDFSHGAS